MAFTVQHVHLKTPDPQKTAQFYIDNFGATLKGEIPGRGVRVDLHGLQLNITTLIAVQNHEQHYGIEHMAVDTDDYAGTLATAASQRRAHPGGAAGQQWPARCVRRMPGWGADGGHRKDIVTAKAVLLASAAPWASASSLAQAICGWMRPPRPQSVPAMTFSRPTSLAKRTMRSATSSGCSTTLVAWLTTPGMMILPSGSFTSCQTRPFVLVAHVAGFERVGAGIDRQHHVDDVAQRNVGGVRAVPAAPAEVKADAVLRQALDRVVQRLDPHHGELLVVLDAWAPD